MKHDKQLNDFTIIIFRLIYKLALLKCCQRVTIPQWRIQWKRIANTPWQWKWCRRKRKLKPANELILAVVWLREFLISGIFFWFLLRLKFFHLMPLKVVVALLPLWFRSYMHVHVDYVYLNVNNVYGKEERGDRPTNTMWRMINLFSNITQSKGQSWRKSMFCLLNNTLCT